ncbi:MAG: hypothetical protein ACRELX_00090 [Longimicrobiales bacterium]
MDAGLLLNSFWRLNRVETGIDPSDSFTFQLSLPDASYESEDEVAQFYRRALEESRRSPVSVRPASRTASRCSAATHHHWRTS